MRRIAALMFMLVFAGMHSAASVAGDRDSVQPTGAEDGRSALTPLAGTRVLLFTRTEGFRHGSIEAGTRMFKQLGERHRFEIVRTQDPRVFTDENHAELDAVVFLNTTGDVLDGPQQAAFERYIRDGGGYIGIHAASDTEYEWEFYGELVGAYFAGHPRVQEATIHVTDREHPATSHLPSTWTRTDEWYNFREPPRGVHVLMSLDTSSYEGSTMGESHPIAWCREMGKGRSLYTGGGHTDASFEEPEFRRHLIGALRWVTRRDAAPNQPAPSDPSAR